MPDTILSNGVRLIAEGDTAWKPSTDINLQLFNTALSRMLVFESLHGGEIPNAWLVPVGATWTQFIAIYNGAAAGDSIYLANESITQTTGWTISKPIKIFGSGPLSKILVTDDSISISGSSNHIKITAVNGVEFGNFIIEHQRSTVVRMQAILISWAAHNIYLHDLTFKNITSNCISIGAGRRVQIPDQSCSNITIRKCHGNEWYESFVIGGEGDVTGLRVIDNDGVVTTAHPNSAVSLPYAVGIDPEDNFGLYDDCVFAGNNFDATLLGASAPNPSFGLFQSWSNNSGVNNARVGRVTYENNIMRGFFYNVFLRLINRTARGLSTTVFVNNQGYGAKGPACFHFEASDGVRDDHLIIARNTAGRTSISQLGVEVSGINLSPTYSGADGYLGPTVTNLENTEPTDALLASTIIDDTSYNFSPSITRLNGGALVTLYTTGTDHTSFTHLINQRISTDGGGTWSAATVVYNPGANFATSDPEVIRLRNGNLLCIFFMNETASTADYRVLRMIGTVVGNVITWGAPVAICDAGTAFTACSGKPLELNNGHILAPVYIKNTADANTFAAVIKSTDSGVTWGSPVAIASNVSSVAYNEACLVQFERPENGGGNCPIVSIVRNETLRGYSRVESTDMGATWSAPSNVINLGATNHPGRPAIAVLRNQNLFMFTRGIGSNVDLGRAAYTVSTDRGVTWAALTNYGTDQAFGYASIEVMLTERVGVTLARENNGTDCYLSYQEFAADGDLTL